MLKREAVSCLLVACCLIPSLQVMASVPKPHDHAATLQNALASATTAVQNRNVIRGRINNKEGRPIERVRVELQDEVEMFITQAYTDALGRYFFNNLSFGTFIIKVHSNGTYAGRSARITLTPARIGGGSSPSHQEEVDFVLQTLQETRDKAQPSNAGVTFVQEVPEPARKQYEKASNLLDQHKTEEGVEALKQALKLFPDYFLAWERLGIEYVKLEQYEAAFFSLSQAVRVNPNSPSSHYALGYTQYQQHKWADADASLSRSIRLAPASPNVPMAHFYLGMALVKENKPVEAETELKTAYEQGKNNIPVEVHLSLAQIYSNTKRYKLAADELEVYLKRAPNAGNVETVRTLVKQLRTKEAAQNSTQKFARL